MEKGLSQPHAASSPNNLYSRKAPHLEVSEYTWLQDSLLEKKQENLCMTSVFTRKIEYPIHIILHQYLWFLPVFICLSTALLTSALAATLPKHRH